MALVRCTCVVDIVLGKELPELRVEVADPDCGYPPHRALHVAQPLATG